MTLPTDLKDFLLIVIAQPLVLGALVAGLLQVLFNWWEQTHNPIRAHDKTLVSALAPPVAALLLWLLAAGLGFVAWSWAAAAQAVYNGVLATVGGQIVYGTIKKVVSPPPTITNIGTINAQQDANLGSTITTVPPVPYVGTADRVPDPTKRKAGF